jgi:diguanylate cyclase (GGDEF)-like protein/PAS domain S-box-containing protein
VGRFPQHPALDAIAALAATSVSVVVTDATQQDNPVCYANPAFSALSGYANAEIVGRNLRFLQGPDTDALVVAEIREAVALGVRIRRDILNYRKDGTTFWNELTIDPIRNAAGQLLGFVSSQYDATLVHLANDAKAEAQSRLDSITDHIPGYFYRRVMHIDGAIELEYCSPSLARMLEIDEADVPGSFHNHVHADDRKSLLSAIHNSASNLSSFREEFRLVSASGVVHWLRSDASPRSMANGDIVWDGLAVEISAEKRWQSEIANLALRDSLTGLLNREAWRQAVAMQTNEGADASRRCGLLYADIVEFRVLNDRLGQRAADQILCEIAKRLSIIAASVMGLAARLGGDEFAILIPDCSGEDALRQIAMQSNEALAAPMQVAGQSIMIGTCIGAAIDPAPDSSEPAVFDLATELMTQAELALRWAKQAGDSAYVIYSKTGDDRFRNKTVLARSLERAIANNELELHYQPQVNLASGRIVSAETLVRWNHPTLGLQRPDLFIPLAEEIGLIVQLGQWVLEQAVRQRKLWQDAGLQPPPIAINVSGKQLTDPGFVVVVADTLARLQANANDFEIELTEGHLIEASPQIMTSLHALRDMGFVITIDDFGSGHATFRYLRDFPVDKVKIDQLFVRKLVLGSNDALIIRAVISLARSMDISFVAEGIETDIQLDFLLREGCETGQGYLMSMPLVPEDFAWMIENDVRLPRRMPAESPTSGRGRRFASGMGTRKQ